MSNIGAKSDLLNVLGDVKARVQDKLGIADFPMPQFILIGKQSVGKSRLIEALAGECFNFISGTLGSRRPTVLEFRHSPGLKTSKWFVRDQATGHWQEHTVAEVMTIVGARHEELGETVSKQSVYVRIESDGCLDMQIVDLPGFRDFALDERKQDLGKKIEELDMEFMRDPNNVILCVEQAGDASTMSSLQRCRNVDPNFKRTILIRNKLDKYYKDLTADNVNKWVEGFGDLPANLPCFAVTLPWWKEGSNPPKPFQKMRQDMNDADISHLSSLGLSKKYLDTIGFNNFASFMEQRVETLFGNAIQPVLNNLKEMRDRISKEEEGLRTELSDTDPARIESTTRDCGISFATALTHVMEGVLNLEPVTNLEDELRQFHELHKALGSTHLVLLPAVDEGMADLSQYIEYLRIGIPGEQMKAPVPTMDVEVNGGAQFRRLMNEVEIFLRFSEIAVELNKKSVIQARGVAMSTLTWRDVVVKLLANEAHQPLQKRIRYIGERIRWFFEQQKQAILEFMDKIEGTPAQQMYSPLYPKHAKLMKQNAMIRSLVFQTYDNACKRQYEQFVDLFDNMLTSIFSNPWVFLKGGTGALEPIDCLPDFKDVKERVETELNTRSSTEVNINRWLNEIPTQPQQVDEAVDKVQGLVLRAYGYIRSQVCDQVELFSESFFKMPMMRRLEEDMAQMELSEQDRSAYAARREGLTADITKAQTDLKEVEACIKRIQDFQMQCAGAPVLQRRLSALPP